MAPFLVACEVGLASLEKSSRSRLIPLRGINFTTDTHTLVASLPYGKRNARQVMLLAGFEKSSRSHTTTDTHTNDAVLLLATLEFANQVTC